MRYYAEVPIKAASGYVIGTYAVVDSAPRHGLDEAQYLILADIALSIMRHLATLKIESDHNRASTSLRGLDVFVQKSERTTRLQRNHSGNRKTGQPSYTSLSADDVTLDYGSVETRSSAMRTQSSQTSGKEGFAPERPKPPNHVASEQHCSKRVTNARKDATLPDQAHIQTSRSGDASIDESPDDGVKTVPAEPAGDYDSIENTFSRAANLLREAMDLDGIVFLDASFSGFGSRVELDWLDRRASTPQDTLAISPTTTTFAGFNTTPNETPKMALASRLGSSSQRDIAVEGLYSLPQPIHQSLIRHFPRGEVFVLADELSVTRTNLQMCSEPQPERGSKRSAMQRKYASRLAVEDALRSFFPRCTDDSLVSFVERL